MKSSLKTAVAMENKSQLQKVKIKPRLIIHGGAGNLTPAILPPVQYEAFRKALLSIVSHPRLVSVMYAKRSPGNNDR